MKILHTSDWHLGRTLYGRRRYEEFAAFLHWLAEVIAGQGVEALLVAHLPAADRDDMAELIFDVNGAGGDGELVAGIQRVFDWTLQRSTRRDLDIDTARRLRQNAVEYAPQDGRI